jgi:RHS repeat-associated protein
LNGNLLSDGYRTFTYDDENELTSVVVSNGVTTATLTSNIYDGKMRLRIRREYAWSSGWLQIAEVHYIYDGNLVIQERDASNLPVVTYSRGNDFSGGLQGAGRIGGLLARSQFQATTSQLISPHAYYHCDGIGNITAMINSLQMIVAKYEYDPFGNITSQSGPSAAANLYRFSSKEYFQNSGLIYYLYRFYDPNLQRWSNRDPIEEKGGVNLFRFVGNNSVSRYDDFGLSEELHSASGGVPHLTGLPLRHKNYLSFSVTCPCHTKYAFDHVDTSRVGAGLLAAGFTPQDLADATAQDGGLSANAASHFPPLGLNCEGAPVTANVWMESRFSNPWFTQFMIPPLVTQGNAFSQSGAVPDFATAAAMDRRAVAAYVAGTILYYRCESCPSQDATSAPGFDGGPGSIIP